MSKTRKTWSKQKPSRHQRTLMLKRCGKKCFLGTNKSFPICKKNTCKISKYGLMAAYKRAKEYKSIRGSKKYSRIANKAKKMLKKGGAINEPWKTDQFARASKKLDTMVDREVFANTPEAIRSRRESIRQLGRNRIDDQDLVNDTIGMLQNFRIGQ